MSTDDTTANESATSTLTPLDQASFTRGLAFGFLLALLIAAWGYWSLQHSESSTGVSSAANTSQPQRQANTRKLQQEVSELREALLQAEVNTRLIQLETAKQNLNYSQARLQRVQEAIAPLQALIADRDQAAEAVVLAESEVHRLQTELQITQDNPAKETKGIKQPEAKATEKATEPEALPTNDDLQSDDKNNEQNDNDPAPSSEASLDTPTPKTLLGPDATLEL